MQLDAGWDTRERERERGRISKKEREKETETKIEEREYRRGGRRGGGRARDLFATREIPEEDLTRWIPAGGFSFLRKQPATSGARARETDRQTRRGGAGGDSRDVR